MILTDIATDMKRRARENPDQIILPRGPLTRGAGLKLKYLADVCEFRLQVQRPGIAPNHNTAQFNKWHNEIEIFARYFEAPPDARVSYQKGKTSYAVVIKWSEEVTGQDIDEMENSMNEHLAVELQ